MDDSEVTTVIEACAYWATKIVPLSAHAAESDAAAVLQMLCAGAESGGFPVNASRSATRCRGGGRTGFVEDSFAGNGQ